MNCYVRYVRGVLSHVLFYHVAEGGEGKDVRWHGEFARLIQHQVGVRALCTIEENEWGIKDKIQAST